MAELSETDRRAGGSPQRSSIVWLFPHLADFGAGELDWERAERAPQPVFRRDSS